ncbi:hypothetical protein KH5_24470 [Urechidicola sp. KH5]
MKKLTYIILFVSLFFSAGIFAQNQSETDTILELKKHPLLTDKFLVTAGLYAPSKTIKIGIDGSSENDVIDLNESFDLDQREETFAGSVVWRFSKKWHLGVEYFNVRTSYGTVLEENLEWEDVEFVAGLEAEIGFGLNMYRIFFGRTLTSGDKHEWGVGLGAHAMDIKTYLEGSVYLDDDSLGFERRDAEVIAPVPNIGTWYYWAPNEKLALTARIDWFALTIKEYSGSLWNLAPSVRYQVIKNVGVGVSYRYFITKLNIDQSNWNGSIRVGFHGPLFMLTANF